jgi:hypothetical protein
MNNKQVLLVEGKDDEHLFYSLLMHHKVPKTFTIKNKGGITRLLNRLDVELIATGLETLGIVVDANTKIESRWQSLCHVLNRLGYTLPTTPEPNGTIVTESGQPTIGIWLMPDNQSPGILEDFVGQLVPDEDELWDKAKLNVDEIETPRFPAERQSKAYIHTWLAWQKEPGKPAEKAVTARYLDPDAAQAVNLIDFLRRLFKR